MGVSFQVLCFDGVATSLEIKFLCFWYPVTVNSNHMILSLEKFFYLYERKWNIMVKDTTVSCCYMLWCYVRLSTNGFFYESFFRFLPFPIHYFKWKILLILILTYRIPHIEATSLPFFFNNRNKISLKKNIIFIRLNLTIEFFPTGKMYSLFFLCVCVCGYRNMSWVEYRQPT